MEKKEKFSLPEEIFRDINYLVNSLVKPLLSRNFVKNLNSEPQKMSKWQFLEILISQSIDFTKNLSG